jgi:hypothetical protein
MSFYFWRYISPPANVGCTTQGLRKPGTYLQAERITQCMVDVSSAVDDPGARPLVISSLDRCSSGFWVVFVVRGL